MKVGVAILGSWVSAVAALTFMAGPAARAQEASAVSARQAFEEGQQALSRGDLDRAERSFRSVLARDPTDAGAYANLGVILMRRRQWPQALNMLRQAKRLAPGVAGIRLNIGLVYYRQNEFVPATPAFESVVKDEPESLQARYLLGLCYFFTDRDAEAAHTLEPLWAQESSNLNYLYVLEIAAEKSNRTDLRNKALARMVEVGADSAEFHLLMGKAFLTELDNDKAIAELHHAAQADPKLPFVHYNLGIAYRRRHDFARAQAEFLKDTAIEPDVAFNYDQLGAVLSDMQQNSRAEGYFRHALRLDSHMASSWFGLAKIEERTGRYAEALKSLDRAGSIDPKSASVHYLRGEVLQHLGEHARAATEFAAATRMQKQVRDELEREVSGEKVSNPELTTEP
ncbi:MAG TPA: tetratricopeptide repeat protein [Terriglobia bacterium]|nr:tetratricopeptide repeat protein [Terriglobia bacterium]